MCTLCICLLISVTFFSNTSPSTQNNPSLLPPRPPPSCSIWTPVPNSMVLLFWTSLEAFEPPYCPACIGWSVGYISFWGKACAQDALVGQFVAYLWWLSCSIDLNRDKRRSLTEIVTKCKMKVWKEGVTARPPKFKERGRCHVSCTMSHVNICLTVHLTLVILDFVCSLQFVYVCFSLGLFV